MPATSMSAGEAARIRSPISVCWRTNVHSASVSGPGFVEHGVGDADLADVVQQGRLAQVREPGRIEPEAPADGDREIGDLVGLRLEARLARVERLEQGVLGTSAAGRPPALLVVEPLVAEVQRGARVDGLLGDEDRPERRSDA